MGIEDQIRAVLRPAFARSWSAEKAMHMLSEAIPGISFPQVIVHRDDDGKTMRFDVTYFDEIHDPSQRSVAVAKLGSQ